MTIPGFSLSANRSLLLTLLPLGGLHFLAWLTRDRVIDGTIIVSALAIMSALNLVLVALLKNRFTLFAVLALVVTYFLHLLFFLLFFFEQRLSGGI